MFWRSDVFYTQAILQCVSTTSFKVDKQYTIFPEAFRITAIYYASGINLVRLKQWTMIPY